MTKALVTLMAAVALSAAATKQASALVIINQDNDKRTFVVVEAGKKREMTLAPGEASGDVCKTKCIVRLPNGVEQAFEGPEVVSIEDNMLFLEEVAPDQQMPGGQPAQK